jgi:hypothetical protein
MKRLAQIAFAAALGFSTPSHAQIPVFDGASLAQLVAEITQLQQMYSTQIEQFANAQAHFASVTGLRDFTTFLSSLEELRATISGNPLQNIADDILSGTISGPLAADINSLLEDYNIADLAVFSASDKPQEVSTAIVASVNAAALAIGRDGQTRASTVSQRASQLRDQVGDQTDLKAAVEMNTLVLTEIAANQATLIELMSTMLANQATGDIKNSQSSVETLRLRLTDVPALPAN